MTSGVIYIIPRMPVLRMAGENLTPDKLHDNTSCRDGRGHAQAGIEHPRSRAHAAHFSAETKDCTTDQGTLSNAAAVTRATPAAVRR